MTINQLIKTLRLKIETIKNKYGEQDIDIFVGHDEYSLLCAHFPHMEAPSPFYYDCYCNQLYFDGNKLYQVQVYQFCEVYPSGRK